MHRFPPFLRPHGAAVVQTESGASRAPGKCLLLRPVHFCSQRPICPAFFLSSDAALTAGWSVHLSPTGTHSKRCRKTGVTPSQASLAQAQVCGVPGAHLAAGILLPKDERTVELSLQDCADRDFHQLVLELCKQRSCQKLASPQVGDSRHPPPSHFPASLAQVLNLLLLGTATTGSPAGGS